MTDLTRLLAAGLHTHEQLSTRQQNATTLKETRYCQQRLGQLEKWLTWLEYTREFHPAYRRGQKNDTQ